MEDLSVSASEEVQPSEPTGPEPVVRNFWDELDESADLTLEEQGLNPNQVITMSTPTGQMATIISLEPASIQDLIVKAGLSLSPSAQFVVDGTMVGIDHVVAPGGHVAVSVPMKAG